MAPPYPGLLRHIVLHLNLMPQALLLALELSWQRLALCASNGTGRVAQDRSVTREHASSPRATSTASAAFGRREVSMFTLQRLPDSALGLILGTLLAFQRLAVQVLAPKPLVAPE